ncbi:MAG: hypothetical protein M3296_10540 [Actinomycetota bacterium]|nr:hypothetical protein [Actinomycetota bacterium]
MIRRPPLLLAVCALLVLLAVPASAPAAVNVAVAVADQSPRMFGDSHYRALHLKKTRYFIHWDAMDDAEELAKADAFVSAARAANVKVLMHISTNRISGGGPLPSVARYRSSARALIRHFRPLGVREWGVWNEANHRSQPTSRNPRRAAQFYRAFKPLCTGCTIVALDVLDQRGVESYIRRWMAAAGSLGRSATIIGIHNYSEVNRRIRRGTDQYPGTARIIKAVRRSNRRARFWYTETGGVVNFGGAFPCNRRRPVSRTKFMFSLARRYRANVKRLYVYNWTGADCEGFDAGLTDADGTLRPAYATLRSQLRNYRR